MGRKEEERHLKELFENLFQFTDLKEGMNLINEELNIREKQGYDVTKYRKKYHEETSRYPELRSKLN